MWSLESLRPTGTRRLRLPYKVTKKPEFAVRKESPGEGKDIDCITFKG